MMDLSLYNENKEKIHNQEYEYIVDGTDIGLDTKLIGRRKGDIIEYFPKEIVKELGDNDKNCFIPKIQNSFINLGGKTFKGPDGAYMEKGW